MNKPIIYKLIILLALPLTPFNANAAPNKILNKQRSRLNRAKVDVKKINRKKIKTFKPKKPQFSSAKIMVNVYEKKLIKGINKTISYLRRTADRLPKKSIPRYRMLKKILNLQVEQAAYLSDGENKFYSVKWKRWDRNGQKGPEPQLNNAKSKERWKNVANISTELLREFSSINDLPEVIFSGALAYQFLGMQSQANSLFKLIIKKYKSSSFTGDAYFAQGDYYFDKNNYQSSVYHYTKALNYKTSDRYGWALFKLAWSYYNLGNFKKALYYWKQTISYSNRIGSKKGIFLKNEALRDMVYAYVELGDVNGALRFYNTQKGKKHIPSLLKSIGLTLTNQGRFTQAVSVLKKLIRMVPMSEEAYNAQTEIISLLFELKYYRNIWPQLKILIKRFGPQSRWALQNKDFYQSYAKNKTKELFAYYPKIIHQSAQKNNVSILFDQAVIGYNLYLKYYPNTLAKTEIKEYLADIYFFKSKFESSGILYESIVKNGQSSAWTYNKNGSKKENIHKRSADNMLDSYNKNFAPELKKLIKKTPDFSKPIIPISKKAKKLINGCNIYTKFYPNNSEVIFNCTNFIAEIYYRSRDKKNATKYFWSIIEKKENSKEAISAASTLVFMYKNDPKMLTQVTNKLITFNSIKSSNIGKKLNSIKRDNEINAIKNEKSFSKRAKLYLKQATKYPKDPQADKFLYNAAVSFLQEGDFFKGVEVFELLIRKYPKSSLYLNSVLELGKLNDDILNLSKAASYYSLYLSKSNGKNSNYGAIFARTCRLQTALNSPNALRICRLFAKKYPSYSKNIILELVDSLWRSKNYNEMIKLIQDTYLKLPLTNNERLISYYKIYKSSNGKGTTGQIGLNGIYKSSKNRSQLSGEALRYLGEIYYNDVKNLHHKVQKKNLVGGDINKLQKSIEDNLNSLENLEKRYQKLFSTKDSYWGVVALYNLGESYEIFANKLRNPPNIKGATKEQLKKQLQPSVDHLVSKSKQFYTSGLTTMRRFNIYNEWTIKTINGLNRILKKPISFEEIVISPDYVGSEVPPDLMDRL